MADVVPIRGREVIEALEQLLAQARKGEIVAMANAVLYRDDTSMEGWAGEIESCAMTMFGSINTLRDQFFHVQIEHIDESSRG